MKSNFETEAYHSDINTLKQDTQEFFKFKDYLNSYNKLYFNFTFYFLCLQAAVCITIITVGVVCSSFGTYSALSEIIKSLRG